MHQFSGVDADTRSALQGLVVELAWKLDHGEPAGFSSLFEPGARIETAEETFEGAEAIDSYASRHVSSRRTTRHVLSNHRLIRIAESVIEGTVVATRYCGEFGHAGADSLIEFRDVYSRDSDGVWRIRERRSSPVFEEIV